LVFLCSSRICLIFEDRLFSEVAVECLVLSALQSFLAPKPTQAVIHIFGICAFCVAIATRLAKEHSARLLKSVRGADSFLDHAVKQKFTSVGSAIHHVMEAASTDPNNILKQIFHECRMGQDLCHMSSVALQFEGGSFVRPRDKREDLLKMLQEWMDDGEVSPVLIELQPAYVTVSLLLDWDLLRVLFRDITRRTFMNNKCDFTPTLRMIVLDSGDRVQLHINGNLKRERKTNTGNNRFVVNLWETVAKALGGTFSAPATLELPLAETQPIFSPRESPPMFEGIGSKAVSFRSKGHELLSSGNKNSNDLSASLDSRDSLSSSGRNQLPQNLTVAAVDDSLLVRKSLQQIFKRHMNVSQESYVAGLTYEEALRFPSELGEKKVNIAIFDENLEYEEETLNGTLLGVLAREKRFTGCLILHSANTALSVGLDPSFDGFVEKTSSHDSFVAGVSLAWTKHLNSIREQNAKMEIPSTTSEQVARLRS